MKANKEKKKVLVIHTTMNFGGAERACLNFIKNLKDDVDIDLLLLSKEGELLPEASSMVNVLSANKRYKDIMIPWFKAKKMGLKTKLFKLTSRLLEKFGMNGSLLNWAIKKEPKYEYDACVCYFQSPYAMDIALRKVNAKKKVLVVHSAWELIDKSKEVLSRMKKFDKILCVSESCKKQIGEHLQIPDKMDYVYNFQENDIILEKAKKPYQYDKEKLNIVTVCRCCQEKGVDRLPYVINQLKEYNFCWTIVGDGPMKEDVYNQIVANNCQDKVNFVGYQDNPFQYIKNADLLAIISYSEAAPMVIGESFVLGVPVLSTKTISVEEMIAEKGWVCENNNDAIVDSIRFIIENKSEIKDKKKLLKNYIYDNDKIKQKLLNIIED